MLNACSSNPPAATTTTMLPVSTELIPTATHPVIAHKATPKRLVAHQPRKVKHYKRPQQKVQHRKPQYRKPQQVRRHVQARRAQPQRRPHYPRTVQHQQPKRVIRVTRVNRPRPQIRPRIVQQKNHNRSHNEMLMIGNKIFKNEAGGRKDQLVHWNHGENFAAMGIGHFTWYPSGQNRHQFGNTFPGLLNYLERHDQELPSWLKLAQHTGAPWKNRKQLMRAKGSFKVTQLENLLYRTKHLQAQYIVERAKRAMPRLVKKTTHHLRPRVAQNLNAVANTPGGWYALVDYVNFKGEGLSRRGGYRGQNWGLLQVLENMNPATPGNQALHNFADSAIAVLRRRVRNSPPRRNEARWMNGWSKRINTYRYPLI